MLKKICFALFLTAAIFLDAAELKLNDGWVVTYGEKAHKITPVEGGFIAKCLRGGGGAIEVSK